MIAGKPFSHCLARIPKAGETRGNLAAGGRGVAQPLSARDREIALAVGPLATPDELRRGAAERGRRVAALIDGALGTVPA